jgi:hypothetical protein
MNMIKVFYFSEIWDIVRRKDSELGPHIIRIDRRDISICSYIVIILCIVFGDSPWRNCWYVTAIQHGNKRLTYLPM